MRLACVLVVAVMLGLPLVAGPVRLAARPGQKAALVTVIAETGTPIRDLKRSDFIVKEDGRKNEILDVRLADEPLSVALLIDTSQPPMGASRSVQDLRTSASTFVKTIHAGSPDAGIALVSFAGAAVTTVDFTNKASDLEQAISRLYPDHQSISVMLEAMLDAAKQLQVRPAPRRAMVTVDFNSPEGSPDRMVQQSADAITSSGATLWAVSVRGTGTTNANREEVLNKVTKTSGGKRFSSIDSSGLEAQLEIVAASLTSQYIVTFTHPGDTPAKSITFETTRGPKVLLTPFMR